MTHLETVRMLGLAQMSPTLQNQKCPETTCLQDKLTDFNFYKSPPPLRIFHPNGRLDLGQDLEKAC